MPATKASLTAGRSGDNAPINPRPRNPAYASSRPARTEGASRGIMRPGGRAVFRGDRALRARRSPVRHKCDPLLRSEPTPSTTEGFSSMGEALPVLPDVTRRREHLKRTAARGWAVASGAASTFRHRHSARSRRLRRRLDPAPSLGWRSPAKPRGGSRRGITHGRSFRGLHYFSAGRPGRSAAQTRDPFRNSPDRGSGMDPGSARLRRLSGMTRGFVKHGTH